MTSDTAANTTTAPLGTAAADAPYLTVIVPVYNEERYVRKCLDSILGQTYDMSRAEILVVDGRSSDNSRKIVEEYTARDPRIRLLDNPDRILPAAINVGIRNARAEMICKMDAHCAYHDDYIEKAVETLERTGAHNVVGLFIAKPGADTHMAKAIWLVQGSKFGAGASYGLHPGPERFIGDAEHITAGWTFRRSLFEKVGLFDVRLVRNHDNDMSCRAYENKLGLYFNPNIKADYFSRSHARPFAKTMFRNGLYLMRMWMLRPGTFAKMHIAPALFTAAVLFGLIGGLIWWPLSLVGAAALVPYSLLLLFVTIQMAAREGWWLAFYIPWLIPLTHLCYGSGTIVGVLRQLVGGLPARPDMNFTPIEKAAK